MKATRLATRFLCSTALCAIATFANAGSPTQARRVNINNAATTTPIQHVIVIVGENHTFDNVFGTYQPKAGQTIRNLLSLGIVNADGTPGPNFARARQNVGVDMNQPWHAETQSTGAYATLPQPYTTSAIGQTPNVVDARFPANLPNGPYQITRYVPYTGLGAFTGDPVHRFFQMWQELDGGLHDKFVWVEQTIGTGSNGAPLPAGGFNPKEGAISMGFYNMNPYTNAAGAPSAGDVPFFKLMADTYAISDNYHQAILGGTGANFQAIATGHAAFFTDPVKLDGSPATPYANQIENPDPAINTNNYYTQDGYGGGSYVNCSDLSQPGVGAVNEELREAHVSRNCAPGHFYLVNNYSMYWNQVPTSPRTLGPSNFVLPPQTAPTIASVLTANNVSWKWYTGDRGNDVNAAHVAADGEPMLFNYYCDICDPLTSYASVMNNPTEYAKLQNFGAFLNDVQTGALPSVSFMRPPEALAGHPADSQIGLYENFIQSVVSKLQANPALWATTAVLVTVDEGGGYYDSGYVQPVDFFGDGTRVPLIAISPLVKKGFVDHTYYDHVSILKFIERNWRLPTVSALSRDNLPNPRHDRDGDGVYRPENRPAIGDLMNLFAFSTDADGDGDHDGGRR